MAHREYEKAVVPKDSVPTSAPAMPAAREMTASSVLAAPTSQSRIQVVGAPITATMLKSTITGENDGPMEVIIAERIPARYLCRSIPISCASFRDVRKNTSACTMVAITMTEDAIHSPGLLIIA